MMTADAELVRIARTVHYANVGWNIGLADRAPDPGFDILPDWHKQFIVERVRTIRDNLLFVDDEDLALFIHQQWVDLMLARGWRLGKVKDPAANPPTHPCLQDFRKNPPEQQKKDLLAIAIVRSLL